MAYIYKDFHFESRRLVKTALTALVLKAVRIGLNIFGSRFESRQRVSAPILKAEKIQSPLMLCLSQ